MVSLFTELPCEKQNFSFHSNVYNFLTFCASNNTQFDSSQLNISDFLFVTDPISGTVYKQIVWKNKKDTFTVSGAIQVL